MGSFIDLTGNTYGKLTVIKRVENRGNKIFWLCECGCGNKKEVNGSNLRNVHTASCGKCPVNTWEVKGEYVIGYTSKGEGFAIDLEDYKEVSKYTWRMHHGYIVSSNVKGKWTQLHRFIMKAKDGEIVDHIFHKKFDNRKSQLRICTVQENGLNRSAKGYTKDKANNKYIASIIFNCEKIYLGYYNTKEEARFAYCEKAIELFGDFVHEDVVKDYEKLNIIINIIIN